MLLHVPENGSTAASEGIQNVPPHSNVYLAAPPDFAQAGPWDMPQHSIETCQGNRIWAQTMRSNVVGHLLWLVMKLNS